MDVAVLLLILFLLTFCAGFCSASETALFSLPSTKVKAYASSADPRKQLIARLLSKPRDLLVTVFMLNTLASILLQNAASNMFGEAAGWGLKVGVPFVIMLVFGEIIPKYLGLQNNVRLADLTAPSISFIQNLLKPVRKVVIELTAPISHVLFFYLRKEESISKDELRHVLKTSQEYGVLHADEAELVWGYLTLHDAVAKAWMQPRDDILYYDINEPLTKLLYLIVDQECSRIPVCDKTIDNHVLGIITATQFFLHRHTIQTSQDLVKYLDKPVYVPESISGRTLFRRFNEHGQEIALVVDEYGSISGLITREDLVEVVVGEISDLRDAKDLYTKSGDNEVIVSGRLELDEFNEIFATDLQSENNLVTIGGWLTEQLGDIPKSGTKYETHDLLFQVLAAEPNKIRKIYVRKLNNKTSKTDKREKRE